MGRRDGGADTAVTKLNAVREEQVGAAAVQDAGGDVMSGGESPAASGSQNENSPLIKTTRVDTMLNDVFSLLSLFFLTVGRSRECPAIFCQLGCMKQLLDHMAEAASYTEPDLQPFASRIKELQEIIKKDERENKHPPQLTKLMMRKLEGCQQVLTKLESALSVLSVELLQLHRKLVQLRRSLFALAASPKPSKTEVKALQEELRKIEAKRVDGKFLGPGGSSVPEGQAIVAGILENCFEISNDILVRNSTVSPTLQPIYERLLDTKNQLEHLAQMHRWTLRETDLWTYHLTLKDIDRLRVNGKFVDADGRQPEGQIVLLYLLRRCYGLIYRLMSSSEPISEELMPIASKLSTISKCLKELSKYGGPYTLRDLYPYRLALHQIAGMRRRVHDQDGNEVGEPKWLGADDTVPEGQGIIQAQFEEVEQTIEELLNRDDDDEDEAIEEDGDTDTPGDAETLDGSAVSSSAVTEDDAATSETESEIPISSMVLNSGTQTPHSGDGEPMFRVTSP